MAELIIENPRQERYFANKTAWWQLPQKNGIANLFVPDTNCRVGNDYLISVEVSGEQQGLVLNTPALESLFSTLVLPGSEPAWARKLAPAVISTPGHAFYVRASDKGMYARGVLGLFESLQKAGYVFEHAFWRSTIESLSSPTASQHTREKVRRDLQGIRLDDPVSGMESMVDEVLDAAGRIQRPIHYLTFSSLFARFWNYVKTLPPDRQQYEVTQTNPSERELTTEDNIRDSARVHLRNMMSDLTARRFFLPGAVVRCDNCFASLWYHVDDLRSTIVCRGCRKELNLPAELQWHYALNELVASAVRDHGVVPVIRTALRLFEDSRACFCFLPGLEVRDHRTDPETHVCELDLVWIRDGEFGIAEIKRTPKKFAAGSNLAMILNAALPNRFLLVSPPGTAEQMEGSRSTVQAQIGPGLKVEAWGADAFARTMHIGWNEVRYSILG